MTGRNSSRLRVALAGILGLQSAAPALAQMKLVTPEVPVGGPVALPGNAAGFGVPASAPPPSASPP